MLRKGGEIAEIFCNLTFYKYSEIVCQIGLQFAMLMNKYGWGDVDYAKAVSELEVIMNDGRD
jgi:hypothetical protein